MVEAISGVRYTVIFVGALAISLVRPEWFQENFTGTILAAKLAATTLIIAGLAVVGVHTGDSGVKSG